MESDGVTDLGPASGLLVLYHIGGLYQDLDRSYNKGPFSSLIKPETKMYFPMHHDVNFAQDLMITAPRNPVVKGAIELNLKYRRLWAERGGKGTVTFLFLDTNLGSILRVLFSPQLPPTCAVGCALLRTHTPRWMLTVIECGGWLTPF